MGFRNPFRIAVDHETGHVYVGDYGPDGGADPARGPDGQVEFDVMTQPGNYGWPYCIGDNEAYRDYDFATSASGPAFDCAAPVNESPRNTGAAHAPARRRAGHLVRHRRPVGGGDAAWQLRVADGRARLPLRRAQPVNYQVPRLLRRPLVPVRVGTRLDQGDGARPRAAARSRSHRSSPTPRSSGRTRWTWSSARRARCTCWTTAATGSAAAPTRRSTASTTSRAAGARSWRRAPNPPTSSAATQTVQFSSEGTRDPDGDPITYEWDFGDGTAHSTEPNPSHTYTAVGSYRATLTVTDNTGRSGTDDVTVVVGNAAPTVRSPRRPTAASSRSATRSRSRSRSPTTRTAPCRAIMRRARGCASSTCSGTTSTRTRSRTRPAAAARSRPPATPATAPTRTSSA